MNAMIERIGVNTMAENNALKLASASDIKTLIQCDAVTHAEALERVDAVLARKVMTDGKRARWNRLREWIVKAQTEAA
jgi:hypothetical protein